MALSSAVLASLVALLLGVALGVVWAGTRPFVEPPWPLPPSRPLGAPAPPAVRAAFADRAESVARAWLATRDGEDPAAADVARLGEVLAALAADGWALGAADLREALGATSGLPIELVDFAASTALLALETREGAG